MDFLHTPRIKQCRAGVFMQEVYSIKCTRSQSGHIHVGPLLMPHLFSVKHSGQMAKPQVHVQQKGTCFVQQ